jgi:K(+)-stimulated pyrophosphate-energized sodium pump
MDPILFTPPAGIFAIIDAPIYLADPSNIAAMMIEAVVPFLFSAFTIRAISRSASKVVEEVRRQFREITGLMEGKAKPDYSRCVDITTKDALREMILPTWWESLRPPSSASPWGSGLWLPS